MLFTGVQNLLFQYSAFLRLLAKAGRDNDERTCLFLFGQQFHILRTEFGRYYEDGQFSGR